MGPVLGFVNVFVPDDHEEGSKKRAARATAFVPFDPPAYTIPVGATDTLNGINGWPFNVEATVCKYVPDVEKTLIPLLSLSAT